MFFSKFNRAAGRTLSLRTGISVRICRLSPLNILLLGLLLTQAAGLAPAQQYRRALFPHRSVGLCLWDRSQVSNQTPATTIAIEIAKFNLVNSYTGADAVSMVDVDREPGGQELVNDQGNGWYDWVKVFAGTDAWSLQFYNLMDQYPIIIVKSGYPATQYMTSIDSIASYQKEWRMIISYMRSRPQNFFIITTNYPAATDGHAQRDQYSNMFSTWAKTVLARGNDSFGPFPSNVFVLDWFHMLASSVDGYCDPMYASASDPDQAHSPGGDHPSNLAVALIDPIFVYQIYNAAIAYEGRSPAVSWAGPPVLTGNLRNRIQITWQTLSEVNTFRFYVQKQGQTWQTIDSVNAGGTSLVKLLYAVTDSNVTTGTWNYRIKEVDLNGAVHYSEIATSALMSVALAPIVNAYALDQNYPNPFNPNTTIQYRLPGASDVKLTVFNVLGEEMATLVNETMPAGIHTVRFDGSRFASGLYFYRLQAGQYVEMKKFTLVK